jgi:hypothetical protein
MKINIGQKWVSKEYPYEDFIIYDGIPDSFVLSDMDLPYNLPFDLLPETAKIFFWKRANDKAFKKFLASKGKTESSYPYAWYGECKRSTLIKKIKKYNMVLINE